MILAVLLDRITQSFGSRKPADRKFPFSWSALAARRKVGTEKSSPADGAIEAG